VVKDDILIYKWGGVTPSIEKHKYDLTITIWKPKGYPSIPSRLPKKYLVWWLYHHLRIFKSQQLSVQMTWVNAHLAQFFCVVPAHFKWNFMERNDIQITYVITEPLFRGKGMGFYALANYLNNYDGSGAVWYVTSESNIPSQRLAQKLGFKLVGKGRYMSKFAGIIRSLHLDKD